MLKMGEIFKGFPGFNSSDTFILAFLIKFLGVMKVVKTLILVLNSLYFFRKNSKKSLINTDVHSYILMHL